MRSLRSLVIGITAIALMTGPVLAQDAKKDAKKAAPHAEAAASAEPAPATGKPGITKPHAPAKQSLPFPVGRTFVAVTYKDQFFKDDRPTFRVSAQNRAVGYSACNNWSATVVPRVDQRVLVGPVAVTKRACDERLMHNEQVYLFVLRTAQSWFFDGKTLTLTGPYGPITFEPSV